MRNSGTMLNAKTYGEADIENGRMDTLGPGKSEANGESSINMYTLPYVN